MVSKCNISLTILCRIARWVQFSQFNLFYKKDSYGGSRIIPSFFGFENLGPVIFLGRLKICPNEHPYLKFYRVPPPWAPNTRTAAPLMTFEPYQRATTLSSSQVFPCTSLTPLHSNAILSQLLVCRELFCRAVGVHYSI